MDGTAWQGDGSESSRNRGETTPDCGGEIRLESARLARAIEFEIIPRLLLAHRVTDQRSGAIQHNAEDIAAQDVDRFVKLILLPDEGPALEWILSILERPVPVDAIYLNLLAPAARQLGELWQEDLCDFTEVTIALGRLQQILRELSSARPPCDESEPSSARILLLPAPDEQHTFGLIMVGEFFRASGWQVVGGSWSHGADAPSIVADEWYDAAGFSLAAESHLDALGHVIAAVRRSSRNRDIVVIVGGPVFSEHPDWVRRVGADVTASDGHAAPTVAKQWLARVRSAPRALASRETSG